MDFDVILGEYKTVRAKGIELSGELVKTLSKPDIKDAARKLGMLRGDAIFMETEDESCVMMDYAIHNIRHEGLNAVDRLLMRLSPPEDSTEYRLLRSMQKCQYVLFEVVEVVKGFGVYIVWNGGGGRAFLVDIGFSMTAVPGAAMATHIHSVSDGWFMTTGAALPVDEDAADAIVRAVGGYVSKHGVKPEGSELAALMIRACIAAGASNYIRYATPGENLDAYTSSSVAAPIRSPGKTGRNEPCPCGSGKKFKKCCGMK
jgi:hypothetical protein